MRWALLRGRPSSRAVALAQQVGLRLINSAGSSQTHPQP